jgi:hypothetical protein
MARPAYGGRPTCEGCKSIDVRRWHREGRLHAGQSFSLSWTLAGESAGSIRVRSEIGAVVLTFQSRRRGESEWRSVEQRVPIVWTACHLGGRRAWFRCDVHSSGRYCGRRVALLYGAGELFACRQCYGLGYATQLEATRDRGLGKAQKIRTKLGGNPSIFDDFPAKPKGMHRQTYDRLRRCHDVAAAQCLEGMSQFLRRRPSRRGMR